MKKPQWSKYAPTEQKDELIRVWWAKVKDQPYRPSLDLLDMIPFLVNAPRFRSIHLKDVVRPRTDGPVANAMPPNLNDYPD